MVGASLTGDGSRVLVEGFLEIDGAAELDVGTVVLTLFGANNGGFVLDVGIPADGLIVEEVGFPVGTRVEVVGTAVKAVGLYVDAVGDAVVDGATDDVLEPVKINAGVILTPAPYAAAKVAASVT